LDPVGHWSRRRRTDAPVDPGVLVGRSSDTGRKRGVDMEITDPQRWASGKLVDLPLDECTRLLAERSVGRVAWTGPAGPTVLPVNYVVVDDGIWFRTTAHSSLATEVDDQPVAFQIDEVDEFTRSAGASWPGARRTSCSTRPGCRAPGRGPRRGRRARTPCTS
jgi:hypothetical protein